ncbi:MAG: hypothetical protein P4L34_00690 [Paludibacter sp.]|nr:hypothetical protein [Paludibacter sp.]
MERKQQTSKTYFKLLSLINSAVISGYVLGVIVTTIFFVDYKGPYVVSKFDMSLMLFIPITTLFVLYRSHYFFYLKVPLLNKVDDMKIKMSKYRELVIGRIVYLSLPAVLSILAVAKTNAFTYFFYTGFIIYTMIVKKPTLKSAITDMKLNKQEIAILEDPESLI